MRLKDFEWGYSKQLNEPLNELNLWAIKPMRVLAEILDEEAQVFYDSEEPQKTERFFFAVYELGKHIEDLGETLERFNLAAIEESERKEKKE